jgi:hypothetical protein
MTEVDEKQILMLSWNVLSYRFVVLISSINFYYTVNIENCITRLHTQCQCVIIKTEHVFNKDDVFVKSLRVCMKICIAIQTSIEKIYNRKKLDTAALNVLQSFAPI